MLISQCPKNALKNKLLLQPSCGLFYHVLPSICFPFSFMILLVIAFLTLGLNAARRARSHGRNVEPAANYHPKMQQLQLPVKQDDLLRELAIKLKIHEKDLQIQSQYKDNSDLVHIYLIHKHNGITISNSKTSVVAKEGNIVACHSSYIRGMLSSTTMEKSQTEIINTIERKFNAKKQGPIKMVYFLKMKHQLRPAWQFQIRNTNQFWSECCESEGKVS